MSRGGFRGKRSTRKRTAPHNIADEFEREKHKKDLEGFLKKLNEDGTPKKPLTESQIMSILRGAIREKWMYAANKLAYLNKAIVPDDDPKTRRRWKAQCEHCKEWFGKNDIQIDHIKGEHSLKSPTEVFEFYDSIMNIGFDEMQALCEPCHSIKGAMERFGYTKQEAIIFKQVTAWEKEHKKVSDQKELLLSYGFSEEEVSNKEKRRECIWKFIKEHTKEE
jgi:hypothetical protein